MPSVKRLTLLLLPAILMMLAVACGEDPTATPTSEPPAPTATATAPAPEPTATPEPTVAPPEPTPTPEAGIMIDSIRYEDGLIELRIGPEPRFGYDADARIRSNEEGGWIIQLDVGDRLVVGQVSQSDSSTEPHSFTIKEAGVNFPLDALQAGGPIVPWKYDFFDEGVYEVGDSHDHGTAYILVGDVEIPAGTPAVTYTLDEIRMRDEAIELRMGSTAHWGYDVAQRVRTDEVENITITINAGDTLEFPDGFTGSSGNTIMHIFTIDGLGISINVGPGEDTSLGYRITPTEPGTYLIYDAANPDLGSIAIVVRVPGPAPTVHTLRSIRVRDTLFDVRLGDEPALGYPAGYHAESGPFEGRPGEDVLMTINLGDSIVFENGVNGSNRNTESHFFTIDALGIDVELPPDGEDRLGSNFTIAPTEVGTLRLYCSAHPDAHGSILIVVQ